MFVRTPGRASAFEKVFARLASMNRGDMASWAELAEVADLPHDSDALRGLVYSVRRALLKRARIGSYAVPGEGIRIATISEQVVDLPLWHSNRASRSIGRARDNIDAADPVDPAVAAAKHAQSIALAALQAKLASDAKTLAVLMKK